MSTKKVILNKKFIGVKLEMKNCMDILHLCEGDILKD